MSTGDSYIDELYRDQIATVDKSGKRIWIYPKQPNGRYYNYRKIVSYALLVILIGTPFIKWGGRPLFLFNVVDGEFILFGIYFAPQDFHLFVVAMLISIVFIALFTVIFGRLFCGWVCPQTIFMEMVFRRIEYWIEGDRNAQKRLNKSPWTSDKVIKKGVKQFLFLLVSIVIAHIFLSYIIGVDEVRRIVFEPTNAHWSGFVAMVVFTLMFYGVFSILREQVCTTICPYGRMQGVLLDEDSLAVTYDFVRGEDRGKLKAKKDKDGPALGDCIDCGLCIKVCPTGIDIRNGTQLECVNCTACMDACDEIMTKVDRPTGLIRIASHNGVKDGKTTIWSSRVAAYSAVLIALVGLESFMFISRTSIETLFLRTPGMVYQEQEGGYISNLYNYQLINKSDMEAEISYEAKGMDYVIFENVGQAPRTIKNEISEGAIFIKIPKDKLKSRSTKLTIVVYADNELVEEVETTFMGPNK